MTNEDDASGEEALPVTNTTKAAVNAYLEGTLEKPFPYGEGCFIELVSYMGDEKSLLEGLRLNDPEPGIRDTRADIAVLRDAVRQGSWLPFQTCFLKFRVTRPRDGSKGLNKIMVFTARDMMATIETASRNKDLPQTDREYVDILADIFAGWMPTVVDAFVDYRLNPVIMPGPVADFLREKEPELRVYLGRKMRSEEVHEVYNLLHLDYVNA